LINENYKYSEMEKRILKGAELQVHLISAKKTVIEERIKPKKSILSKLIQI
jgi:hypothetical protein